MSEQLRFNEGGPAFPVSNDTELDGMSLRDWFAGQERLSELDHPTAEAPMGMCEALGGPKLVFPSGASPSEQWSIFLKWESKWRATLKYLRADAMIEARKKRQLPALPNTDI